MRLLLAEDDRLLGQATCKALEQLGHEVEWLTSGLEVARRAAVTPYDCALIDLGLPEVSGRSCIQALRQAGNPLPVIVLTAAHSVETKIDVLDLGADDYLVKPFDVDELAARVRAVVRRKAESHAAGDAMLVHGPLLVNTASRAVSLHGEYLHLTSKEFWLLDVLVRSKGRIVTRQALDDALYGWDGECASNAIEVFVYQLRRKLGAQTIRTVRGIGYRLASEAEMIDLQVPHAVHR